MPQIDQPTKEKIIELAMKYRSAMRAIKKEVLTGVIPPQESIKMENILGLRYARDVYKLFPEEEVSPPPPTKE